MEFSLVAQMVKYLQAMHKTWILSLGWEDPLQKGMATHPRILSWRIPWTEKNGGLQFLGLQRVGHDWATNIFTFNTTSTYHLTVSLCQQSKHSLSGCFVQSPRCWPEWVACGGLTRAESPPKAIQVVGRIYFSAAVLTVVSGTLLSASWRLSLGPRDCRQFLVKQALQPGHSFHQVFKVSISLQVGLGTSIDKSRPTQEDHSFGYPKIIMINYICKIPSCLTLSVCWSNSRSCLHSRERNYTGWNRERGSEGNSKVSQSQILMKSIQFNLINVT